MKFVNINNVLYKLDDINEINFNEDRRSFYVCFKMEYKENITFRRLRSLYTKGFTLNEFINLIQQELNNHSACFRSDI